MIEGGGEKGREKGREGEWDGVKGGDRRGMRVGMRRGVGVGNVDEGRRRTGIGCEWGMLGNEKVSRGLARRDEGGGGRKGRGDGEWGGTERGREWGQRESVGEDERSKSRRVQVEKGMR